MKSKLKKIMAIAAVGCIAASSTSVAMVASNTANAFTYESLSRLSNANVIDFSNAVENGKVYLENSMSIDLSRFFDTDVSTGEQIIYQLVEPLTGAGDSEAGVGAIVGQRLLVDKLGSFAVKAYKYYREDLQNGYPKYIEVETGKWELAKPIDESLPLLIFDRERLFIDVDSAVDFSDSVDVKSAIHFTDQSGNDATVDDDKMRISYLGAGTGLANYNFNEGTLQVIRPGTFNFRVDVDSSDRYLGRTLSFSIAVREKGHDFSFAYNDIRVNDEQVASIPTDLKVNDKISIRPVLGGEKPLGALTWSYEIEPIDNNDGTQTTPPLPAGINFNTSTGEFSGVILNSGEKGCQITVTATDTRNYDKEVKQSFTLGKPSPADTVIKAENTTIDFAREINVASLFEISAGAGRATYKVENKTGEGSFFNGTIHLTKAGIFDITCETEATSRYQKASKTITLTVRPEVLEKATANTTIVKSGQAFMDESGNILYRLALNNANVSNSLNYQVDGVAYDFSAASSVIKNVKKQLDNFEADLMEFKLPGFMIDYPVDSLPDSLKYIIRVDNNDFATYQRTDNGVSTAMAQKDATIVIEGADPAVVKTGEIAYMYLPIEEKLKDYEFSLTINGKEQGLIKPVVKYSAPYVKPEPVVEEETGVTTNATSNARATTSDYQTNVYLEIPVEKSGTYHVNLYTTGNNVSNLTDVKLDTKTVTMSAGGRYQFLVLGRNDTNNIEVTSLDPTVASVVLENANDKRGAKYRVTALRAGNTSIRVTIGGVDAYMSVIAVQNNGYMTVDTKSVTMGIGDVYDIGVAIYNATNQKLTSSQITSLVQSGKLIVKDSRSGSVVRLSRLSNGNYRVIGRNHGSTTIEFDLGGVHASVNVNIARGARRSGQSSSSRYVFTEYVN